MKKVLNVEYNSQRDNLHRPGWACNVTCLQMALAYGGIKVTDDYLWEMANGSFGRRIANELIKADGVSVYHGEHWIKRYLEQNRLNEIWYVLEKLADNVIGEKGFSRFGVDWLTLDDIKKEIDLGYPVLATGAFTGAGHVVLIIGYDDDFGKGFICHDPWGNYNTGYVSHNGENAFYLYTALREILKGHDGKYWNMKVHADKRVKV